MNNFILNIENTYDLKELCGSTKIYTFCTSDNIYISNHDSFNNIDELCNKYNLNKYYCKGTPDNRIIQLCIIPADIIYINKKYRSFVVAMDIHGNGLLSWYIFDNTVFTIFDNPIDAAKDYYNNMINTYINQIDKIYEDACNWIADSENVLLNAKNKLFEKYNKIIEQELLEFEHNEVNKTDKCKELLKQYDKFILSNKKFLDVLHINYKEYGNKTDN